MEYRVLDVRAARPKLPETVGFELVTPPGQTDYRVVVGFPDGFWSLPLPSRAGRPARDREPDRST